jgi:acetyltransferase
MAREEVFRGIKDLGVPFPIYEFPEAAARALSLMLKYRRHQQREIGTIPDFDVDSRRVKRIFAKVRAAGRVSLSTTEGFEVLDAYGIRCAPWELCTTPDAAAAAAGKFGYPVVVKLISHDVSHKSDFGGVVLDLRSAAEVAEAVATILGRVQADGRGVEIEGFLVQPMIRGGKETILGVALDPVFGPLVMFGMGGIYVEVLKDISFRLAPITDLDAAAMLRSIRAWPLLAGVRGESSVHLETVEEALLRVSRLITDFEEIVEFDVNPFIAHEDLNLCLAVDARIRLRE